MANVIVSFPKSGRTWIRGIIGHMVCSKHGWGYKHVFNKEKIKRHVPYFPEFHHDNVDKRVPFSQVIQNKKKHGSDKVVFMRRDPRDVMVSYYFHRTHRKKDFKGDISSFIRSEDWGVERVIDFCQLWNDAELSISYEQLHFAPQETVQKVVNFFEIDGITETMIYNAVNFCKFGQMQEMEKTNRFDRNLLKPTDKNDVRTYKVREGLVGGYQKHLSPEDISFINQLMTQKGYRYEQDN